MTRTQTLSKVQNNHAKKKILPIYVFIEFKVKYINNNMVKLFGFWIASKINYIKENNFVVKDLRTEISSEAIYLRKDRK